MSFMQKQVTDKQTWYRVDGPEGITNYPANMFSIEEVAEMSDADVEDVEIVTGYGARMSAPGYMDCTEWCIFDTETEAEEYLEEYYGDEDDGE